MADYLKNTGSTTEEEMLRRITDLEHKVTALSGNRLVTLDRLYPPNVPTPVEGQEAINSSDDQHTWYANGQWREALKGGEFLFASKGSFNYLKTEGDKKYLSWDSVKATNATTFGVGNYASATNDFIYAKKPGVYQFICEVTIVPGSPESNWYIFWQTVSEDTNWNYAVTSIIPIASNELRGSNPALYNGFGDIDPGDPVWKIDFFGRPNSGIASAFGMMMTLSPTQNTGIAVYIAGDMGSTSLYPQDHAFVAAELSMFYMPLQTPTVATLV